MYYSVWTLFKFLWCSSHRSSLGINLHMHNQDSQDRRFLLTLCCDISLEYQGNFHNFCGMSTQELFLFKLSSPVSFGLMKLHMIGCYMTRCSLSQKFCVKVSHCMVKKTNVIHVMSKFDERHIYNTVTDILKEQRACQNCNKYTTLSGTDRQTEDRDGDRQVKEGMPRKRHSDGSEEGWCKCGVFLLGWAWL